MSMKQIPVYLLLLILGACGGESGSNEEPAKFDSLTLHDSLPPTHDSTYIHHFCDSKLEKQIIDTLRNLSFVRKSDQYIDSLANHRKGIAFMLDEGNSTAEEISVQAGYNGDERFETYYRFLVNPKTMAIFVYDPVTDQKITIRDYLKTQK